MKYFLGADIGGTMTKAVVFDQNGRDIAVFSAPTPVVQPAEGFVERDMNLLWDITADVIRQAVAKSGVAPDDIVAVGCTGHGKGLYPWGDGAPAGNAIASTDSRAESIVRGWNADGTSAKAAELTLQPVLCSQPVALLRWLRDNNRAVYDAIRIVFEAKDYIRFRLTGEEYAELTDYSGTSMMNLRTAAFDPALFELFGIPEISGKLPPLRSSYDLCGRVTIDAAARTGLIAGTAVCGGMFDIDACAVAMDVTTPENLCVISGTWSINEYISKTPVTSQPTTLNSFFALPGYYLIEESSPTSAGNLEWVAETVFGKEKAEAAASGTSVYDKINEMVASVDPAASNAAFIPFLYGTNCPGCDSAVLAGLSVYHTRAHIARAVFEGVVFSHMTHIDRLLKARTAPPAIRLAGGVTASPVWVQMFADAAGLPVEVVDVREIGALGCAMAGAVAAGVYADYTDAARHMVRVSGTYLPDMERNRIYRKKYERYSALTAALAGLAT